MIRRRALAAGIKTEIGCHTFRDPGRFQRVVRQIASGRPVDWIDVALAGGFSDQARI
jgi:hypothetical protein